MTSGQLVGSIVLTSGTVTSTMTAALATVLEGELELTAMLPCSG
jgi:hypothetical protein